MSSWDANLKEKCSTTFETETTVKVTEEVSTEVKLEIQQGTDNILRYYILRRN